MGLFVVLSWSQTKISENFHWYSGMNIAWNMVCWVARRTIDIIKICVANLQDSDEKDKEWCRVSNSEVVPSFRLARSGRNVAFRLRISSPFRTIYACLLEFKLWRNKQLLATFAEMTRLKGYFLLYSKREKIKPLFYRSYRFSMWMLVWVLGDHKYAICL